MAKFEIYAGLGGGFGGAQLQETVEGITLEQAETWAYELACEEYDSYAGMHGLRNINEIMEDEDCDEDTAWEYFEEDRNSWIDYYAVEIED